MYTDEIEEIFAVQRHNALNIIEESESSHCRHNIEYVSTKIFANEYRVARISYQQAMDAVIKYHYMHRKCPCSRAYGLLNAKGELKGVVTYGVPCSSTLLKGVCGEEERHNVYELNRLWVADDVPKNGESFLVANSMKDLDKEIIVSFSDTSVGHYGFVYQATNFLYCGLSAKFRDIRVKGKEGQHSSTFAHGMTYEDVVRKYGAENVYYAERPRKHRYVYFNANPRRKKELMSKLRYKIYDYPKGDSTRHEANETYGY